MPVTQFYRWPALNGHATERLLDRAKPVVAGLRAIESEWCFNVDAAETPDRAVIAWLFAETFEPDQFAESSELSRRVAAADAAGEVVVIVEVHPRHAPSRRPLMPQIHASPRTTPLRSGRG